MTDYHSEPAALRRAVMAPRASTGRRIIRGTNQVPPRRANGRGRGTEESSFGAPVTIAAAARDFLASGLPSAPPTDGSA
jgi:hypothetical protein